MIRTSALPLLLLLLALPAPAEVVVPGERVRTRLMVREAGKAGSRPVGSLQPGDRAELLGSAEGWHHVRLPDGREGFVSQSWSRVVVEEEAPPAVDPVTIETTRVEPGFRESVTELVRRTVLAPFGGAARVDFLIRQPEVGVSTHRHHEPELPVSGLATIPGSDGAFDVMLVLDASTSTNEFAEADVDLDGVREDEWKSDDSIFQAQIAASMEFVRTLSRLPGNREGERIRVGVLTFAGDERFHRIPEGKGFDPSPDAILDLGRRDAELRSPLTSDYTAVLTTLRELRRVEPRGMTNVAAGIGRAVTELEAIVGKGSESSPRRAEKVIHLMTDGKPRLPYDREVGEWSARRAARMAANDGIRINVFALGENVVTRDVNDALRRTVRYTDGQLLELEQPGDIVSILSATSFAYVDHVRIVNRTNGEKSDYIGTGIDGSFYGEIPLAEGANQIQVVAVLHDERETSRSFNVAYERVPEDVQLAQRLTQIREENEALIEQIREQLAAQVEEERAGRRQRNTRKTVELGPEQRPAVSTGARR